MTKRRTMLCASNNQGKIKEFKEMFSGYDVLGLKDMGINVDIPENGKTFEENALIKLRYLAKQHPDLTIIADDSGLCVNALDGAPGVYSARYSGEDATDASNNKKLLEQLDGIEDRSAYFVCVLALFHNGLEYVFEGRVSGTIAKQISGDYGFGYDPLFIPRSFDKTFADLPKQVKKDISHRANAVKQLKEFLLR
ncbi:RdgB/HAM1 family non-canonical purine NTP pyrophosphatase [Luteibaculum oceani]|uniref:dITP/XTP pyrophosphatase n=1 Tax=Luteibaculum oceani TaxID=1294296 RepID=A0A5C6V8W8_9FLAO|nr:RdgB/HAM1 family non-canonical purine NTP pyrophosphatase [Luteibaculum oceani]TXC81517.1 RdgB/HAM1 family non-canonical purine NTP pyrophosphatase [Luteibaculum oceani]